MQVETQNLSDRTKSHCLPVLRVTIRVHTYIYIYIYDSIGIYDHIYVYVYMYNMYFKKKYIYIYTYNFTCVCVQIDRCTVLCIIHAYICAYIQLHTDRKTGSQPDMQTRIQINMSVWVCARVSVCEVEILQDSDTFSDFGAEDASATPGSGPRRPRTPKRRMALGP